MRKLFGVGKPRCLQGQGTGVPGLWAALVTLLETLAALLRLPAPYNPELCTTPRRPPELRGTQAAA
jgi:hypothetical protein